MLSSQRRTALILAATAVVLLSSALAAADASAAQRLRDCPPRDFSGTQVTRIRTNATCKDAAKTLRRLVAHRIAGLPGGARRASAWRCGSTVTAGPARGAAAAKSLERCSVVFAVLESDPEFGMAGEVSDPGGGWRLMNEVRELGDPVEIQHDAPANANASLDAQGKLAPLH